MKYALEDAVQTMKDHFIIEELNKMEEIKPKASYNFNSRMNLVFSLQNI